MRIVFFVLFFCLFVYKASAGWKDDKCPPNQFGFNVGNKNLKNSKAKKNNNNNDDPDGMASVYQYLASQGLTVANKGVIHVNTCDNSVRFIDRNGNETPGNFNKKGEFVAFNKAGKKNLKNQKDSFDPNLSDTESQFIKMQYKMLCSGDMEDINAALQSNDPKILTGACIAAAEFNLDVNDRLLDLLNHEEDIVSQSARKGLLIQSFYLMSKIKRIQSKTNDYFIGKPTPENLLKYTSGKNLEIGKDYVDFGPLPSDDNLAINNAITRWQVWFKRNESKFNGMTKDPLKSSN